MPAEAVKVGPFSAGLQIFSDPSSVPDNALVEALNFELDLDGSLRSRFPAIKTNGNMPIGIDGEGRILGTFKTSGGGEFLIASDGVSKTYFYDGTSWQLITNSVGASAMCQFNGKAYLIAATTSDDFGGKWDPLNGWVEDQTIPRGDSIVGFKSRLWIAQGLDATINGTRLTFSQVLGQSPFWKASPDFIDIGQGDGENIVALTVYYQSLLIFRTDSIWQLSYTTDPANGNVAVLIPGVGLRNKDCLVKYESYLYFQYQDKAYQFVNARAEQINDTVPFTSLSRTGIVFPYSTSVFNDRILFQFYDTTYVYNLNSRTWTRWRTTEHRSFGKWFERPTTTGVTEIVCFSNSTGIVFSGARVAQTLSMHDEFDDRAEVFECIMQTKNYDYETAAAWKSLKWWHVSAAWNGKLHAIASAINFKKSVTWGQLRQSQTWGSIRAQTWGTLSGDTTEYTTDQVSSGTGPQRKESKVGKAIRFKRVNFRVVLETDGSSQTGPARVFYLTTFVRAGETIVKDVS